MLTISQENRSFSGVLKHRLHLLKKDVMENWFFFDCNHSERARKESSIRTMRPELREFVLAKRIASDKKRLAFEDLARSITMNAVQDEKTNGQDTSFRQGASPLNGDAMVL